MKVVIYNSSKHKQELACLVVDYFKETTGDSYVGSLDTAIYFIDNCKAHNYYIYVLCDDDDNLIGFVSMYVFNMYGFTNEYLVVDHMYILPTFRGTKAIVWLYSTVGKVMTELGLNAIGTTYLSSSNDNNNKLVNGVPIATVTSFSLEDIDNKYKKYMRRLNVH